ncbi:hypothetical protein SAMN02745132_04830, partial [Enterovibrio nigricans DSM 22720]
MSHYSKRFRGIFNLEGGLNIEHHRTLMFGYVHYVYILSKT